jgi:hypothetical protein
LEGNQVSVHRVSVTRHVDIDPILHRDKRPVLCGRF